MSVGKQFECISSIWKLYKEGMWTSIIGYTKYLDVMFEIIKLIINMEYLYNIFIVEMYGR